jgi:hypothetical protein
MPRHPKIGALDEEGFRKWVPAVPGNSRWALAGGHKRYAAAIFCHAAYHAHTAIAQRKRPLEK